MPENSDIFASIYKQQREYLQRQVLSGRGQSAMSPSWRVSTESGDGVHSWDRDRQVTRAGHARPLRRAGVCTCTEG